MDKNVDQPEQSESERLDEISLKVARETLTGDIRDVILNDMKERKTSLPWSMRTEAEQEAVIDQITRLAESIVERAVKIVAAGGRKTISATLKKVTVQDGIQAVLELSKTDQQRHELIDATGTPIMIVVADPAAFTGECEPVFPSPDQKPMFDGDPETGEVED